jgi:hypothetical protein
VRFKRRPRFCNESKASVFVHELGGIDGKAVGFCKATSVHAAPDPSAHDRQHRVAVFLLSELAQAEEEENSEMIRGLLDLKESRETLEDLERLYSSYCSCDR